ncbi:MAG: tellurite resistance TerB family protein [Magnetovibrionaceae bacterium]
MIDEHAALIYTMVLVSAADNEMSDQEIRAIGEIIDFLPVFRDFDRNRLAETASNCAALLDSDEGLETVLGLIATTLPPRLRETAYALACEVAVSDLKLEQEELRMLEMMRHALELDRLVAAAIERGVRARYTVLDEH